MNQQEMFERLEQARALEKEGAALIEEAIAKMYSDCDAAWELFDRGVKLCEEGTKIRDSVEENINIPEPAPKEPFACGKCPERPLSPPPPNAREIILKVFGSSRK